MRERSSLSLGESSLIFLFLSAETALIRNRTDLGRGDSNSFVRGNVSSEKKVGSDRGTIFAKLIVIREAAALFLWRCSSSALQRGGNLDIRRLLPIRLMKKIYYRYFYSIKHRIFTVSMLNQSIIKKKNNNNAIFWESFFQGSRIQF